MLPAAAVPIISRRRSCNAAICHVADDCGMAIKLHTMSVRTFLCSGNVHGMQLQMG